MKDRVALNPGRVLVTPENGSPAYYAILTRADNPQQEGDALNKNNLLKDETAAALGLDIATNPQVNDAFLALNGSKAATTTYTATVPLSWVESGGYFYNDVTVNGIVSTDNPIVDINPGSDNAANALYSENIGKVFRITTSENSVRLWARETVDSAFPIQLKVVR